MSIHLEPDEQIIYSAEVPKLLGLFWLKQTIIVTNKKVYARVPNTFLSLIPLGFREDERHLTKISSVQCDRRFSIVALIAALVLFLLCLSGFVVFIVPLIWALNYLGEISTTAFRVSGMGADTLEVSSPIFFNKKIMAFTRAVRAGTS